MLRRIGIGFLFAIIAYLIGAFGRGFLISILSSNQHDKEMEAAIVGFVVGVMKAKPKSSAG